MIVVHQPSQHPFVEALTPDRREGRGRSDVGAGEDVWDVERLSAAGVGLVHLHFGFERRDPAVLRRWAMDLDAAGIGLVHTVHDLDNPHLTDQSRFHDAVGALIEAAGAVTTLTPTAALTIRARYGATAAVIAHPHVVPLGDVVRWRARRSPRHGIYVHVASGRPNMSLDVIERLAARPGRQVRVHARPSAPALVGERLERLAARGRIHLEVRPRLSDAALWDRLSGAELVVLAYRWGTHSGLLEAAHDLGTPVLAPSFGGYGDQGAITFADDPAPCVADAVFHRPPVTVASRRSQQQVVRQAYAAAYRAAKARVAA